MKKFIHLDFVRGLAALLVVFHHVRVNLFPLLGSFPQELQGWFIRGYIFLAGFSRPSVLVFFTLSGFLIIRKVASSITDWTWRGYLIDRLVRLWVVLVPSLFATSVLVTIGRGFWKGYSGGAGFLISSDQVDISGITCFCNLLFLQELACHWYGDNTPLWSLSYEWWYYILFPLMALVTVAGGTVRLAWLAFLVLLSVSLWHMEPKVLGLFPCWLCGGLVVALEASPWRIPTRWGWLALPAGAFQLLAAFVAHRILRSESLLADYLLSLSVAVFIMCSVRYQDDGPPGLYHRIASKMSDCSYSVYLFHNSMIGFLFYLIFGGHKIMPTTANLAWACVIFFATLSYCICCYLLFERHTPRVRRAIRLWLLPCPSFGRIAASKS